MEKTEKRTHPRAKFLKPFKYKGGPPLRRAEAVDAKFLNISAGGACIMAKRAYEPDKIVWLRLPPHPRLAKVKWVGPILGRYKMGLKFLM
jgi:hypothetical protein